MEGIKKDIEGEFEKEWLSKYDMQSGRLINNAVLNENCLKWVTSDEGHERTEELICEWEKKNKSEENKKKINQFRFDFLLLLRSKEHNKASEMLANYIKENLIIYTTKNDIKREIWVYRDGIYRPNGKSEIEETLRKILEECYSIFHVNNALAKIEADTFIEHDEFFKIRNVEEIAVMNGILNIRTRQLTPFTPNKIFFSKMPVYYIEGAECPMIDKFLEDVLPYGEDKNVFYEIGGYILTKENKYEKAFMFYGGGRNGKDKSIELIKRIIGADNYVSIPLSKLNQDGFGIDKLFGKHANLCGEISNADLKDTSTFKACIGNSTIRGDRKFLNELFFVNFSKFVFACNNFPMVYDNSIAFWERWVALNFPYTFLDKDDYEIASDKEFLKIRDTQIIKKLTSDIELSGLLNKFLDGFDRLEKNQKFSTTQGSKEVKETWMRGSNSFMAFCMDNLEENYDASIRKKDMRKKYTDYCKFHKISGKSDFVIKNTLAELFGASEDRITFNDGSHFGVQEHCWVGIQWKKKNINQSL